MHSSPCDSSAPHPSKSPWAGLASRDVTEKGQFPPCFNSFFLFVMTPRKYSKHSPAVFACRFCRVLWIAPVCGLCCLFRTQLPSTGALQLPSTVTPPGFLLLGTTTSISTATWWLTQECVQGGICSPWEGEVPHPLLGITSPTTQWPLSLRWNFPVVSDVQKKFAAV